jgi:hypothetical protein
MFLEQLQVYSYIFKKKRSIGLAWLTCPGAWVMPDPNTSLSWLPDPGSRLALLPDPNAWV